MCWKYSGTIFGLVVIVSSLWPYSGAKWVTVIAGLLIVLSSAFSWCSCRCGCDRCSCGDATGERMITSGRKRGRRR